MRKVFSTLYLERDMSSDLKIHMLFFLQNINILIYSQCLAFFGNRVLYLSAGFWKSVRSELPTQEKLYSQDSQHTLLVVYCNGYYWNIAHTIL